MSRLLLLLAAFATVLLSGCSMPEMIVSGIGRSVTGSGDLVTLEPTYQDFSRVDFSHAFQAEVTQGEVLQHRHHHRRQPGTVPGSEPGW